jgi:hypothetical protein
MVNRAASPTVQTSRHMCDCPLNQHHQQSYRRQSALTITYLDAVDVISFGLGGAFQYRRNEGVAQTGSVLDGSETHYLANARLLIGITQAFKVSQMLLVTE